MLMRLCNELPEFYAESGLAHKRAMQTFIKCPIGLLSGVPYGARSVSRVSVHGLNLARRASTATTARRAMAERPTLHFVTGNENKVKEARLKPRVVAIFAADTEAKIPVQACKIDLPELQGEPEDIARNKCAIAVESINGPVMVEDTCLCFNAYHGLPGPYVKWFLEKMGHSGLNTMLDGFRDKTGYAQCTIAYTSGPGADIHVFVGRTEGKIVQARGPTTFGWDPIFEPEGFTETYAEMSKDAKNAISHRRRALEKLRCHLLAHQ